MKSSQKEIFFFGFFLLLSFNIFSCKFIDKNIKFKSFVDDDEIVTITTDDEFQLVNAIEELNEKGGTIYIDTPVINMYKTTSLTIGGRLPGGIIGIRQSNGEYPRINFQENYRDELFFSGINIYGSNKFIEYMIIENSLSYGITVIGDSNILDHVISRYNYGSGIVVYGDFNTLNYCYSYRNCDANQYSVTADGFQILGEQNNVFNYCFAWDNSNNGFNYVRIFNSSELSYLHSGSWNNGNIHVFTGKYDYDNGDPLDKNLWTIQEIIQSDPNFVSNYYNKKFSIDDAFLEKMPVNEWISYVSPKMEGDGFTFGNKNSSQSIDVKRNSLYNVAFDHRGGGFIDRYSHKYNAYVVSCAGFNNGINFRLPYTFSKWSDNWSWGGKSPDQLSSSVSTQKPKNVNTHVRSFYTVRDQIIKAVTANMFPDGINFDRVIGLLN
jgi:hypothetical protein